MEIKTVSIIGQGVLGTLFGKIIIDNLGKNTVRFVADKKRIARYEKEGVYSNGEKCDFLYQDSAAPCTPADLVIFTVKFTQLDDAIKTAKNQVGKHTIILSLLNGIVSEENIGQTFGMDNILYSVAQGMDAIKRGNQLTYKLPGRIEFGEADGTYSEKVKAVDEFFTKAGIAHGVPKDMIRKMWSKWMLNVGANQVVTAYETNYRSIQTEGEIRDKLIAAMHEVVAIANHRGIDLNEADVRYWLDDVLAPMNPEGMPSMRQDTEAHRKTEVDLFAGSIIKLGKEYGIPTPVNQFLYDRIREIENKY
jgi:2-dehydropantoate 2-reductase